jgi:hypothetical protein
VRITLARAAIVTTYDDDGQIVSHEATPATASPPPRTDAATPGTAPGSTPVASERGAKHPTSAELRLMADRLDICAPPNGPPCEKFGGRGAMTVACHGCGCAGLSLRSGVCQLGKWPQQNICTE